MLQVTYPESLKALPPQIIIGAICSSSRCCIRVLQKRGKKNAAVTYTGDGGSSQGDFYEGINYAGAYKSPTIFIQNKRLGNFYPRELQTAAQH